MPLLTRSALAVAATCVSTFLVLPGGGDEERVPVEGRRRRGVRSTREEVTKRKDGEASSVRSGWRLDLRSGAALAEEKEKPISEADTLWMKLQLVGKRKLEKGVDAQRNEDIVKKVTKLSIAISGKQHSDKLTRHVGQMFEADGYMLPVKGSAHQEEFDIEYEGLRTPSIIADATATAAESELAELVQSGALQALKVLWSRKDNDGQDEWEIARAVANLATHEDGRDEAEDSGWREILEAQKNCSSPYGGRLQAESTRAIANLNNEGSIVYKDGLSILHDPVEAGYNEAELDVVFIHGLRGGSILTWRTTIDHDPLDTDLTIWPRDWLAREFPNVRILSVDYDGQITKWAGKTSSLQEQATRALDLLDQARVGERPVTFVAHSYGGIVTKQLLTDHYIEHSYDRRKKSSSLQNRDERLRSATARLRDHFMGAVFFATPHRGSPFAEKAKGALMDSAFRPAEAVVELQPGAKVLESLDKKFTDFVSEKEEVEIVSFAEGLETAVANLGKRKLKTYLVPPDSAFAGSGRLFVLDNENHIGVCKPPSTDDVRYEEVRRVIGGALNISRARKKQKQKAQDLE